MAFYGFDTARLLKSLAGGLLVGDAGVDVETSVMGGNSSVVVHVHPINSVSNGRGISSFLEIATKALNLNVWLSLAHIPGEISIAA